MKAEALTAAVVSSILGGPVAGESVEAGLVLGETSFRSGRSPTLALKPTALPSHTLSCLRLSSSAPSSRAEVTAANPVNGTTGPGLLFRSPWWPVTD